MRKKFGQGPPSPSFGQNPKESVFSQENVRPLAASVASSLMHRIVNRQRIELRFKERSERRRRKLPAISSENFFNRQNGSRVRETFQIREAVDKKKRRGHRGWGLFSKHKNSFIGEGEKCKLSRISEIWGEAEIRAKHFYLVEREDSIIFSQSWSYWIWYTLSANPRLPQTLRCKFWSNLQIVCTIRQGPQVQERNKDCCVMINLDKPRRKLFRRVLDL